MPVSAGDRDELEQMFRIKQMRADIRLKEQALAPRQLFASSITAIDAVIGALDVFFGHHRGLML
jgi:hypothetical protein